MAQAVKDMTDQALVVELLAEAMIAEFTDEGRARVAEIETELRHRHGEGAPERLSQVVVDRRMTASEMVLWAATGWADCHAHLVGPKGIRLAATVEVEVILDSTADWAEEYGLDPADLDSIQSDVGEWLVNAVHTAVTEVVGGANSLRITKVDPNVTASTIY